MHRMITILIGIGAIRVVDILFVIKIGAGGGIGLIFAMIGTVKSRRLYICLLLNMRLKQESRRPCIGMQSALTAVLFQEAGGVVVGL